MNPDRKQLKSPQNNDRFLWENEEEATLTEMESVSYSVLSVGIGLLVIITSCTLWIIF